jgi:hypothetical protein
MADEGAKKEKKEKIVKKKKFTLDGIGDLPIGLTVFPGSIEGDRIAYSVLGKDRAVMAYGTANQVIDYSIGEEIRLSGKDVPEALTGTYKRTVNRKHLEAAQRVRDELHGTGGVAARAGENNGKHDGYTVTVNGERVTPESILNSYFTKRTFVKGADAKPVDMLADKLTGKEEIIMHQGKPVEVMGGVEVVVSAIIVPGSLDTYRRK